MPDSSVEKNTKEKQWKILRKDNLFADWGFYGPVQKSQLHFSVNLCAVRYVSLIRNGKENFLLCASWKCEITKRRKKNTIFILIDNFCWNVSIQSPESAFENRKQINCTKLRSFSDVKRPSENFFSRNLHTVSSFKCDTQFVVNFQYWKERKISISKREKKLEPSFVRKKLEEIERKLWKCFVCQKRWRGVWFRR